MYTCNDNQWASDAFLSWKDYVHPPADCVSMAIKLWQAHFEPSYGVTIRVRKFFILNTVNMRKEKLAEFRNVISGESEVCSVYIPSRITSRHLNNLGNEILHNCG